MQYLHISTGSESNIGVLKLPKLKMIVPKVDSVITKAIHEKLPRILATHFDAEAVEIKSITFFARIPLTIEVNVFITDHEERTEHTVYANETWVY